MSASQSRFSPTTPEPAAHAGEENSDSTPDAAQRFREYRKAHGADERRRLSRNEPQRAFFSFMQFSLPNIDSRKIGHSLRWIMLCTLAGTAEQD